MYFRVSNRLHHRDLQRAVAHAVHARRELIGDACQTAWAILLRTQPERYAIVRWLRVVAIHEAYRLSTNRPPERKNPRSSRGSRSGASRTRTPDLLGAIQAVVRGKFGFFAGISFLPAARLVTRICMQFAGDRGSSITREARSDETRTGP